MKRSRMIGMIIILLIGLPLLALATAALFYPPEYLYRVLVWQNADAFDWQKYPSHPLHAAPEPYKFDVALDSTVSTQFAELAGTDDWEAYLSDHATQAFIVIHDGAIVYEEYFNGTQRDSTVTSYSMAKSFVSTLIGLAIQEGFIESIDDPITDYLPELAERDVRFREITIRHLLLMSSGLEYVAFRPLLFNGDDPLTSYYPDQRKISLDNTHIVEPPGVYFRYNKYHPQLLGMILERSTGMTVTEYLQTRLWDPLGMEFDGSWSTDSKASDFEKMESHINARAVDFAKFGMLFLNDGIWRGKQVINNEWVAEATRPVLPTDYAAYYPEPTWFAGLPATGTGYYTYMWWGIARDDGSYDFAALGNLGQIIYVSPRNNIVIVRNGIEYGLSTDVWLSLFYSFADSY